MLQFVRRQPLARPDLHHRQIRRPAAAADHLSRALRQRRLPIPLRVATGVQSDGLHDPRVSRVDHAAAVGGVGNLPPPAADGHSQSADLPRRLRGSGRAGRVAQKQAALVVASPGGDALLPSTHRARLGPLPGPTHAAAHAVGGTADT